MPAAVQRSAMAAFRHSRFGALSSTLHHPSPSAEIRIAHHIRCLQARLLDAVAALLRGNHEVLRDFTDEEAGLLVALLTRPTANLDRVASVEASPGTPISEKTDRRNLGQNSAV